MCQEKKEKWTADEKQPNVLTNCDPEYHLKQKLENQVKHCLVNVLFFCADSHGLFFSSLPSQNRVGFLFVSFYNSSSFVIQPFC